MLLAQGTYKLNCESMSVTTSSRSFVVYSVCTGSCNDQVPTGCLAWRTPRYISALVTLAPTAVTGCCPPAALCTRLPAAVAVISDGSMRNFRMQQ